MLFKLALKNIIKKPLRSLAIVIAIAIAVSMFFSIFSFNDTVHDYIYAQRIADRGDADIFITYTSDVDSERILDVEPLRAVEGVKEVIPSLDLFATYNDTYVRIRGFEEEGINKLNNIKVLEGSMEELLKNPKGIAVSKRTAEALGLKIGSGVKLTLGSNQNLFIVQVIAENDGYFITDELYTFIGISKGGVSRLITHGATFYNQIFVKIKDGYNVDTVISNIKNVGEYSNKSVTPAIDIKDVDQNATSLSAPIAIAGGAVAFLGITFIYVLFVLSEKDRRQYASKLGIIGATKGQIFSVFIIENFMLAFIGAVIGSGLAVGIYVGMIKLILSQSMTFTISAVKLFGASVLGLAVAMLCSLVPLFKAFKSSVKENLMQLETKNNKNLIITIVTSIVFIITTIIEFTVPKTLGYLSIVNILLLLLVLALITPYIMRGVSLALKKTENAEIKIAANNLVREKRNSRTVTLMAIGMIVSMVLFMAWNISTEVFSGYKDEISNLIYIQNVKETVKLNEIREVEGVDKAEPMVITNGDFGYHDKIKSIQVVGTKKATDIFDFEYITPVDEINKVLSSGKKELIISRNFASLYDIKIGDTVTITIKDNPQEFKVSGFVNSMSFNGNFIFVSEDVLKNIYGISINQVVVKTKDVEGTVNRLKTEFAVNNYFVISTEELASWTDKTTSAIFKLIGTIAGVITIFIFVALLSSLAVSRSNSVKLRRSLLSIGLSKNKLLASEITEHSVISLVAFTLSFAFSPLITASLIHALRLFDLSFDFMYNAMIVGLVGISMVIAYILTPIVLNFRKGYKLKIRE